MDIVTVQYHGVVYLSRSLSSELSYEWGASQIDNDQTEMEIFPVIVILLQSSLNNNPSAGREATASIILTF